MFPERSEFVFSSHIPDGEFQVLIFDCLHVETFQKKKKKKKVEHNLTEHRSEMVPVCKCCTDGRDGLHELILLQFEEDGGFSSSIQPQSDHADLHLRTDVDPVVLK